MNLLYFKLERFYNDPIILVANNQMDLQEHLESLGFKNISFRYLDASYGTCTLRDDLELYTAECYYIKKI